MQLLEDVLQQIFSVYEVQTESDEANARFANALALCRREIKNALTRATYKLLDDLTRNVRLLGTPER